MATTTEFRKMHQTTSTETSEGVYQTGIIDISKYDRPKTIRRVNLHYESNHNIIVRLYADGYTGANQICSLTFPHNVENSGPRIVSLRPPNGARAKTISVKIETANVNSPSIIRKLEVEIDE